MSWVLVSEDGEPSFDASEGRRAKVKDSFLMLVVRDWDRSPTDVATVGSS